MKYRARRKPTDFQAVLVTEGGDYTVTLRDATPEGVRIDGVAGYVSTEAKVSLVIRNKRLPGMISWANGDTVGVKLDHPLTKDMLTLITRGTGHPGRPGHARW